MTYAGRLSYEKLGAAAARGETVTIRYSPGGTGAAAMALARANVVVDGTCNSACAWSFVRNDKACFTPRASFGFHAAHDPGTGQRLDAATGYWLALVRPSLRSRLGGLLSSSKLIRISAAELRKHYPDRVCGAPTRTQVAAEKPAQDRAARLAVARPAEQAYNLEQTIAALVILEANTIQSADPQAGNTNRFGFEPQGLPELTFATNNPCWQSAAAHMMPETDGAPS
jgi:hypothetical protein